MNIVYIATDSYVSMLGISLNSIVKNYMGEDKINIYICSTDLTEAHQEELSGLLPQNSGEIHFVDVSDFAERFDFEFHTSGFHPIVLARLLLAEYLPDTVKRVLYLDCDVIVNGNIWKLEEEKLDGNAFAAVPELCMPQRQKEQISLEKKDTYFNCGVLLINLQYWRENKLSGFFLQYFAEQQGKLLYNDQDILNHCCRRKIKKLSHTYNYNPALYYFPRYFIKNYQPEYYMERKKYNEIRQNPVIIHFMGEERPWFHGNHNPYRDIYEKYKKTSPWKDCELLYGKEKILFCYHILNCITRICPWFRKWFTKFIGIYYYKLVKNV